MSFRNERVVSAERVERPKEMSGPNLTTHSGVKVNTDKGNSYLIHNTPASGVVATPASNMSGKWSKAGDIPVSGSKTVGDVMRGGYTSGSGRLGKTGEYLGSGTCKGTAHGAERALKK